MMNAFLISSCLPQNMGGGAILTANRILNRVPKSKTHVITSEKWKDRKPNLKYFNVWGCLANVHVPIPKRVKIGTRLLIVYSLDMPQTVRHVDFWFVSPNIRIFIIIR